MRIYLIVFMAFSLFAVNAQAYIGPGLGAGTVGVVLGILGSIFLTLLAIIYYPIKRMLKKRKEMGKQNIKIEDEKPGRSPE